MNGSYEELLVKNISDQRNETFQKPGEHSRGFLLRNKDNSPKKIVTENTKRNVKLSGRAKMTRGNKLFPTINRSSRLRTKDKFGDEIPLGTTGLETETAGIKTEQANDSLHPSTQVSYTRRKNYEGDEISKPNTHKEEKNPKARINKDSLNNEDGEKSEGHNSWKNEDDGMWDWDVISSGYEFPDSVAEDETFVDNVGSGDEVGIGLEEEKGETSDHGLWPFDIKTVLPVSNTSQGDLIGPERSGREEKKNSPQTTSRMANTTLMRRKSSEGDHIPVLREESEDIKPKPVHLKTIPSKATGGKWDHSEQTRSKGAKGKNLRQRNTNFVENKVMSGIKASEDVPDSDNPYWIFRDDDDLDGLARTVGTVDQNTDFWDSVTKDKKNYSTKDMDTKYGLQRSRPKVDYSHKDITKTENNVYEPWGSQGVSEITNYNGQNTINKTTKKLKQSKNHQGESKNKKIRNTWEKIKGDDIPNEQKNTSFSGSGKMDGKKEGGELSRTNVTLENKNDALQAKTEGEDQIPDKQIFGSESLANGTKSRVKSNHHSSAGILKEHEEFSEISRAQRKNGKNRLRSKNGEGDEIPRREATGRSWKSNIGKSESKSESVDEPVVQHNPLALPGTKGFYGNTTGHKTYAGDEIPNSNKDDEDLMGKSEADRTFSSSRKASSRPKVNKHKRKIKYPLNFGMHKPGNRKISEGNKHKLWGKSVDGDEIPRPKKFVNESKASTSKGESNAKLHEYRVDDGPSEFERESGNPNKNQWRNKNREGNEIIKPKESKAQTQFRTSDDKTNNETYEDINELLEGAGMSEDIDETKKKIHKNDTSPARNGEKDRLSEFGGIRGDMDKSLMKEKNEKGDVAPKERESKFKSSSGKYLDKTNHEQHEDIKEKGTGTDKTNTSKRWDNASSTIIQRNSKSSGTVGQNMLWDKNKESNGTHLDNQTLDKTSPGKQVDKTISPVDVENMETSGTEKMTETTKKAKLRGTNRGDKILNPEDTESALSSVKTKNVDERRYGNDGSSLGPRAMKLVNQKNHRFGNRQISLLWGKNEQGDKIPKPEDVRLSFENIKDTVSSSEHRPSSGTSGAKRGFLIGALGNGHDDERNDLAPRGTKDSFTWRKSIGEDESQTATNSNDEDENDGFLNKIVFTKDDELPIPEEKNKFERNNVPIPYEIEKIHLNDGNSYGKDSRIL